MWLWLWQVLTYTPAARWSRLINSSFTACGACEGLEGLRSRRINSRVAVASYIASASCVCKDFARLKIGFCIFRSKHQILCVDIRQSNVGGYGAPSLLLSRLSSGRTAASASGSIANPAATTPPDHIIKRSSARLGIDTCLVTWAEAPGSS